MAGLLTHLSFGLLGFLLIWFGFYRGGTKLKLIYGGLFVLANIAPDLVNFGILGIVMGSLSPDKIMTHKMFHTFAILGHTFFNWVIVGFIILVVVALLFCFSRISKKTFYDTAVGVVLILIGVAIHLVLDALIIETSYWI
jgi:hypothetical protein